ncbi:MULTISPECIES: helix-turn-helix domain-containing protein [Streptomyces]|uniref:helix-turn-helix domain-containing protein n=1 Tax=Streptomyces TaxID=1883 RepID=UPI000CD5693C|nr:MULTISPECIES: helix-turn-helix domain-containing protein [Streptomyces]
MNETEAETETTAETGTDTFTRAGAARKTRVPTSLAALALGVRESTIRQWARRGKITRYGTRRQALYDLDELTALAVGTTGTDPAAPGPRTS